MFCSHVILRIATFVKCTPRLKVQPRKSTNVLIYPGCFYKRPILSNKINETKTDLLDATYWFWVLNKTRNMEDNRKKKIIVKWNWSFPPDLIFDPEHASRYLPLLHIRALTTSLYFRKRWSGTELSGIVRIDFILF